jgi:hypothetical protein
MSDVIAWPGHGLGIEEPHERITDLVVYPCEVWCQEIRDGGFYGWAMFIKYANQAPYLFRLHEEAFFGAPDAEDLVHLWIDYNWRWAQERIAMVMREALT